MNDTLAMIPLWYSGPAAVAAGGGVVAVGLQFLNAISNCDIYGWDSDKARTSARGVFKIAAASPFVVALWPLVPVVVVALLARLAWPDLFKRSTFKRASRAELEQRVADLERELHQERLHSSFYRSLDRRRTVKERMPVIQDTITRKEHQ